MSSMPTLADTLAKREFTVPAHRNGNLAWSWLTLGLAFGPAIYSSFILGTSFDPFALLANDFGLGSRGIHSATDFIPYFVIPIFVPILISNRAREEATQVALDTALTSIRTK